MEKEPVKEQLKGEKDELGKIDECGERAEYHNLVDILFVLDATGSMSWCMDEMKKTVCKVMKKFADKQYNIKFAIQLYRDHEPQDFTYVEKHFDLRNLDATIKVIDNECEVGGGGDTPEAVFDGLVNGLKKTSWRVSNDGKIKSKRFLFHGCDAPPHGKEYGCSSSDPKWTQKGCPCGLTRHDVKKLLDEYNVDYSLMKIGNEVDTMSSLFKQCFAEKFKRELKVQPKRSNRYGGGRRERRTSQCYMEEIQREQINCREMACEKSSEIKCASLSSKGKKLEKKGFFDKISDFFSSKRESESYKEQECYRDAPQRMAPVPKVAMKSMKKQMKREASDEDSGSDDSQKGGKPRSMASLVCSDIEDGVQNYFQQPIKKQKKLTKDDLS